MSWPYRSPQATRRALADRVRARHAPQRRQQRLREIAYRRLLARLFSIQADRWVVKGGVALLLRLDPNRTSNDIDLAYVAEAGEHALALEALVEGASHDLGDFFEFEVNRGDVVEVDSDHPLERAASVPVVARVGGTVFAEFSVDLVIPRDDVTAIDWVRPDATLTGEAAIDGTAAIALLALPAQVADKVCAIHERHGAGGTPSSRARDLADLAMIAEQKELDGTRLILELRREERRRLEAGTLPAPLPRAFRLTDDQAVDWQRRWRKATRDAPIGFEDALRVTTRFLDPVLQGLAQGRHWDIREQRWK